MKNDVDKEGQKETLTSRQILMFLLPFDGCIVAYDGG